MTSKLLLLFVLVALVLVPVASTADEPKKDDPVFQELMSVRQGLIDAYNKHDLEALVSYCHERIVVTWQNAEVSVGRDGVRAYCKKMLEGDGRVVDDLKADPTVDELAVIHGGDTAISRGKMNDHYKLRDGSEFSMNSRWSATLVNENGKWYIASFHASTNAFDNDILRMVAQRTAMYAGGVAALVGVLLGASLVWFVSKRRRLTP